MTFLLILFNGTQSDLEEKLKYLQGPPRPQMFYMPVRLLPPPITSLLLWLIYCSRFPDHSLTREQPAPKLAAAWESWPTWNPLLLGISLANSLIIFKCLLKSHHYSKASSDDPIQHDDMVPAPLPPRFQSPPHFFFSLHGTCGFPTSSTTDRSMDWLIDLFLLLSLFCTIIQVQWRQVFQSVLFTNVSQDHTTMPGTEQVFINCVLHKWIQAENRSILNYTLFLAINCKLDAIPNLFLQIAKLRTSGFKWFTHII